MIRIFSFCLLAASLLTAAVAPSAAAPSDRYGKQKVVYHINYDGEKDDKAYKRALHNVQNHIWAVGKENLEVRIVLHGDGVNLLRDANKNLQLQGVVSNLKNQNVSFAVCKNTLESRGLNKDDLFEVFEEDIVPSGVAELSYLQAQGYTYIKP